MKKILSIAFAALIAAAPLSARELKFYNGNTAVEAGASLEFTDFTVTPIGNGMVEVSFAPDLYIWSDIFTNTVSMTAECTSGEVIQFCPGGNCVSGKTVTKDDIKIMADQKVAIQYEYIAEMNETDAVPTVVTKISAVDSKHTEVTAEMTVIMNASAGVAEAIVSDNSFKAVKGGISYDFVGAAEVSLYNLGGEVVYHSVLDGKGTIDTVSLAPGIYLYKAGNKSGKIYLH